MSAGEDRAWDVLSGLDTADVCRRADVSFDGQRGTFALRVFGHGVHVSLPDRWFSGGTPEAEALLERLDPHVRLSALWYLACARYTPPSGRLVKPSDMPGGRIYESGSHVLPLDRVAARYGEDLPAFAARATELCGCPLDYADASFSLRPFPRIATAVLLWVKDREFAARASLLVDSGCGQHLPIDIIWSTAMMSVSAML